MHFKPLIHLPEYCPADPTYRKLFNDEGFIFVTDNKDPANAAQHCHSINGTVAMFKEKGKFPKLQDAFQFGWILVGMSVPQPTSKH